MCVCSLLCSELVWALLLAAGIFPARLWLQLRLGSALPCLIRTEQTERGPLWWGRVIAMLRLLLKTFLSYFIYQKKRGGRGDGTELPSYKAAKLLIPLFTCETCSSLLPSCLHVGSNLFVPADTCIPPDIFCLLYWYPGIVLFVYSPAQNAEENKSGEALTAWAASARRLIRRMLWSAVGSPTARH